MKTVEEFLNDNDILDSENIDGLLALADYVRELINLVDYSKVSEVIKYVLDNNALEAFVWIVSILDETYDNKQSTNQIDDFSHNIGRSIANYDQVMEILGVSDSVYDNTMKIILDKHGEAESFFNISIYKTKYNAGYLIGAENFDVKDNDFIQYKLLFTNDIDKYIKNMENIKKNSRGTIER